MAEQAVVENPDTVEQAVKALMRATGIGEKGQDSVHLLIYHGAVHLVHEARHQINLRIRRPPDPKAAAKVKVDSPAISAAFAEIQSSTYNYFLGGKQLGAMTSEDLERTARQEESKSNGHRIHVLWLRSIQDLMEEGKTVRECIPEQKLRELRQEVERSVRSGRIS
jgi:hypothetical protein